MAELLNGYMLDGSMLSGPSVLWFCFYSLARAGMREGLSGWAPAPMPIGESRRSGRMTGPGGCAGTPQKHIQEKAKGTSKPQRPIDAAMVESQHSHSAIKQLQNSTANNWASSQFTGS